MARGGKRQGKPGSQYANRSDMRQAPTAAPGQQYGQAQEQLQAQRAIPLPSNAPPTAPQAAPRGAPPPPQAPPAAPGQQGPFDRPTDRPNEPVTAGLPTGAGPGPEVLNLAPVDAVGAQLHALYQMHPNDDLLRLLNLRSQGAI